MFVPSDCIQSRQRCRAVIPQSSLATWATQLSPSIRIFSRDMVPDTRIKKRRFSTPPIIKNIFLLGMVYNIYRVSSYIEGS